MTALAIDKPRGRAWWKELWIQVLIAMAAGIALGIVSPDAVLIAPIIFCTVVHGIAHMADMARVGRVAVKAIVYFEIMTTIALIIGLVAVNLLRPGVGMNIDPASINASAIEPYVKQTSVIGFVPFLMNIVPATFIGAFAEGNILQVLFISVLCGFALVQLGERAAPLVHLIDLAAKMVFAVVGFVMWAAPIGHSAPLPSRSASSASAHWPRSVSCWAASISLASSSSSWRSVPWRGCAASRCSS
ncbi:Na+/H+-dicarboxylate symporter [Bradyrhizobium diazoefficiens]